jgi:hypothetical protein
MVPGTVKNLMLEQAHRTSMFLAGRADGDIPDVVPAIERQLGFHFNPSARQENLR